MSEDGMTVIGRVARYIVKNKGRVVTKEELQYLVYGENCNSLNPSVMNAYINAIVHSARKTLPNGKISTIRTTGYVYDEN